MLKESVNWKGLRDEMGSNYVSPLPAIEKNTKVNKLCEIVYYTGGEEIISPDTPLDSVYLILSGTVAVGDLRTFKKHRHTQSYYVQSLTLRPVSFLGEIEAPMYIKPTQYPKIEPQQRAWASSEILSRVMAYSADPKSVTVPYGANLITNKRLKNFLVRNLLITDDFKLATSNYPMSAKDKGSVLMQSPDDFLDIFMNQEIILPSEKDIFSRNSKAKLLRIPHSCSNELWKDLAIRRFICEDAFVKSKKYWLMPQEGTQADKTVKTATAMTILALYYHAELNNLLIDDTLYVLGDDRIRAITNKTKIYRDTHQKTIRKHLEEKGFRWDASNDNSHNRKNFMQDPSLLDVYNFMTLGQGGNKEIFKVGRVRNT